MLFSWTVIPSLIDSVKMIQIPLGACTRLQDSPSAWYVSIWQWTLAFSASAHLQAWICNVLGVRCWVFGLTVRPTTHDSAHSQPPIPSQCHLLPWQRGGWTKLCVWRLPQISTPMVPSVCLSLANWRWMVACKSCTTTSSMISQAQKTPDSSTSSLVVTA